LLFIQTSDSSHISNFGIGFDLDQHGNRPNPTGTEAKIIKKVIKQDLQEEDNIHITMTYNKTRRQLQEEKERVKKIFTRAKDVNSCMTCTKNGRSRHTQDLCGLWVQRVIGTLEKKVYYHSEEGMYSNKTEKERLAC
jgi:hypothetical protein